MRVIYHQNCHEAFFCPRFISPFFPKDLQISLLPGIYICKPLFFYRFERTFMNWFSTNSMFINSTYIPLCLFSLFFFLNTCIYLSYFLRNFSFSSRRISISRDYKLSKIAFSKAKNNIIKYFPILQILSRTNPFKINYPSQLDYPKELERKIYKLII